MVKVMAKISVFDVGYCTHPACMVMCGGGLKSAKFPSRAYLLEVKNRLWLWDTGYADHFIRSTARGVYRLYPQVTPVHFQSDQVLIRQLQHRNVAVDKLQGVIISHFHGDHIAGLRDFPDVPVYCSEPGWCYYQNLSGLNAVRKAFVPGLIPEDFSHRVRYVEQFSQQPLPNVLAPFSNGWKLPGSEGEVFLVPLPGHARGQIGAFVHTDEGWTLLAADAAWVPENYTQLKLPSPLARLIMDNYAQFLETLHQLHALHRNGKVEIRLCHESQTHDD